MNASELIVEVRDRDLIRRAQLTDVDMDSLVVVPRNNDVGSWQLTLPDTVLDEKTGEWEPHAAAKALRQEGAGLIVTAPGADGDVILLSGPMVSATFEASSDDLTGTWKFTGVSDTVLLADALAYPDPSNADPATQSRANDKRTGTAEDLLRQYVAFNIANGPVWAPAGRLVGLRTRLVLDGTSKGRGPRLTKSPRFQNLLELCQEIGFAGGLSFDVVQSGDKLVFRIWEARDRSAFVRMDMANDLLKSVSYGYGSPSTTVALVAGQGQGEERTLVSRSNADSAESEASWGRRIERFYDQRNTDDLVELTQKGDEELLAGAASAQGLQAAPTDADAMLYPRDWTVGDIVGVVIEGQEVKAAVTEVAISVSGALVIMVATLGDVSAFDPEAASQRRAQSTSSRVSAIERTLEVPSGGFELSDLPGTLPIDRTTGNLPLSRTSGTMDLPSRTTGNLPLSRTTGTMDLPSRTTGNLPISRTTGQVPLARVDNVAGRGTTAERDTNWGVPTTEFAKGFLASSRPVWFNTDLGWEESYYAPVGTEGLTVRGLVAGVPAGWYPTGYGPHGRLHTAGPQGHVSGSYFTNWLNFGSSLGAGWGESWRSHTLIDRPTGDTATIRTRLPGRYDLECQMEFPGGTGTGVWRFGYFSGFANAGATNADSPLPLLGGYDQIPRLEHRNVLLLDTGRCFMQTVAAQWTVGNSNAWMSLRYVGPPLVTA